MEAIVIMPKDEQEALFLKSLLQKLGVAVTQTSEEDLEDSNLAKLMEDVDKNERVSRQEILTKLGS